MAKKIKVAVIGVGGMGSQHARNFFEIKRTKLVAVCDVDKKRAREVAKNFHCSFYTDYKELFKKEEVDGVSIAVPTSYHFKVASYAIDFGRHVLVEKPITDNVVEAKKLIARAKRNNLILMVGHVERFNPAVVELKKYLKKGEIGRVVSLSAKRVGIYPPSILDTNIIVDLAIHDVDIFSFLLDKTTIKVWALGGKALKSGRLDYAEILLSYKGSVHGTIQVNWITPVKIRNLAVTGTKGYIELDYINQKLRIYHSHYSRSFNTFGEFLVKFGRPDVVDVNIKKDEPLKRELCSFVDCIRYGRKPHVDGKVGLEALVVAEKALSALKRIN